MRSLLQTLSLLLKRSAAWTGFDLLRKSLERLFLRLATTIADALPRTLETMSTAPDRENAEDSEFETEYDHEDDCDCDSKAKVFGPIRDLIDLQAVAEYCTRLRESLEPGDHGDDFLAIDLATSMHGSFNISWKVVFSDGASWLFKVPAAGTPDRFSDAHAEALRSEACTMRLLRRETSIPVPEVFAFSDSCSNELGHPFILMQYIEGRPLYEFWEDERASEEFMKKRRIRCLNEIAAAMVQLGKFSFDKAGALKFDENGQPSEIGPMLAVDVDRELWKSHEEIIDDEWCWVSHGPFNNDREYYMADMNRLSKPVAYERPEHDGWAEGWIKIFDLFFGSLKQEGGQTKQFVLAHPDLSLANIIVSDEGAVRAFIDWDKAHVVPRTLGNESFPNWLTEDWTRCQFEELYESPETLKFYRSVYAEAIRSHHPKQLGAVTEELSKANQPNGLKRVSRSATTTTKSLIYACLHRIGIESLFYTKNHILAKLLDEIASIIEEETYEKIRPSPEDEVSEAINCPWEERFEAMNLLFSSGEGRLLDHHRRLLLYGFEGLLRRSGEL